MQLLLDVAYVRIEAMVCAMTERDSDADPGRAKIDRASAVARGALEAGLTFAPDLLAVGSITVDAVRAT
jgi:hypothetical protein